MDDWKAPEGLRLGKKTEKTGVGRSRNPYIPQEGLKAMSPDQRERTDEWKEKFNAYKTHQVRMTGTCYCEAARWLDKPCLGALEADHVIPRGRHPMNVDGYWNMQGICHGHHWLKTNTPGEGAHDFRSEDTKAWCIEQDQKKEEQA